MNQDDLSADDLGAARAAAHQHLSHGESNCGDSKELAGTDGDIDMGDVAVYTFTEEVCHTAAAVVTPERSLLVH